jgi:MIP family channel proteins
MFSMSNSPNNISNDKDFNSVLDESTVQSVEVLVQKKSRRPLELRNISAMIAEFLGCFLFIFIGAGSIIANSWTQGAISPVGIAAAHGLALGILITVFGVTSGGHFNPAVTIALLVARRIPPILAICYVAAQLSGAALGASLLRIVFPTAIWQAARLGTPALSAGVTIGAGLVVEALLTFFLLIAMYGTSVDDRAPKLGGFAISLTVAASILGCGVLTGAAMNPARAFGPALISGIWTNHFVYWIGPLVGAVLAACIYEYMIIPRSKPGQSDQREKHGGSRRRKKHAMYTR